MKEKNPEEGLRNLWFIWLPTIVMIWNIIDGTAFKVWGEVISNLSLASIGIALISLGAVAGVATLLLRTKWPIFTQSPLRLLALIMARKRYGLPFPPLFEKIERTQDGEHQATNLNFLGAKIKWFGLLFVILIAFNLPILAKFEEEMFRAGTITWLDVVWRSIIFGLAHGLVGVPFGACLGISLAGAGFSILYFLGGVPLSTAGHTTYNLILVAVLFLSLCFSHYKEWRQTRSVPES